MKIRVEISRRRDVPGRPVQIYAEAIIGGEKFEHATLLNCTSEGYADAADWVGCMRDIADAAQHAAQIKELPGIAGTPKPETEHRGFE